jgi:hypothetical protein
MAPARSTSVMKQGADIWTSSTLTPLPFSEAWIRALCMLLKSRQQDEFCEKQVIFWRALTVPTITTLYQPSDLADNVRIKLCTHLGRKHDNPPSHCSEIRNVIGLKNRLRTRVMSLYFVQHLALRRTMEELPTGQFCWSVAPTGSGIFRYPAPISPAAAGELFWRFPRVVPFLPIAAPYTLPTAAKRVKERESPRKDTGGTIAAAQKTG